MPVARTLAKRVVEYVLWRFKALVASLETWLSLFKKTEGWRQVLPPETESVHLLDVFMIDENNGFAVGRQGCILKTTDSGRTWLRLAHNLTLEDLYAVHFADLSIGYAVGQKGTVLRTDDGGSNWAIQWCPLGNELFCTGVFVLNAQRALLVGGTDGHRWTGEYSYSYKPGHLFLTNNGGQNWLAPQSLPAIVPFLNDICMAGPTVGVAVGGCWDGIAGQWALTSIIMQTKDGGTSWTPQSPPAIPSMPTLWNHVSLHAQNVGIVLPGEGLPIYTSDGENWQKAAVDRPYTGFESVCFLDATNAILVGSQFRGTIMKSQDAGANWRTVDRGTFPSLRGVSFGSPSTGIAVGEFSTVVRTVDGGETWEACAQFLPWAVGSDEDLEDVAFQGDTGYAVGWRGTLIKSTDTGASWQPINSILPGLHLVCLKDQQLVFLAIDPRFGRRGLFRSVDGGTTVEELRTADRGDTYVIQQGLDTEPAGLITAMAFGDGQTGVFFAPLGMYGDSLGIYRTTDGGDSWRRGTSPPTASLFWGGINDVQFLNSTTVVAVGTRRQRGGVILRSIDAGVSWEPIELPYSSSPGPGEFSVPELSAVHFPPGQVQIGFAAGSQDTVIRTVDGGLSWTTVRTRIGAFGDEIHAHWACVHFIDGNTGWLVGRRGSEGVIARTNDGGESWQEQGMPELALRPLTGASFLSRDVAVVVGREGFVARTTTGGM